MVQQVRKKIIPSIADSYQKYKRFLADKIKLREKMDKQKEEILREIEKQHMYGVRLTEKIVLWSMKEQSHLEDKQQFEEQAIERLRNYMIEQSRFLAVATARKELMPDIIRQVTHEIHTAYKPVEEQKKYTSHLFTMLQTGDRHE